MDLHGWITQQIDKTATIAQAADPTLGHVLSQVEHVDRDTVADERHIGVHSPAAVLRRCEADRRILNRHRLNPDVHFDPACLGCGTYGDQELSNIDNLNECPELLDLAHAHGLTPEILATLDQPVPPPMPERPEPVAFRIGPPARPTSSVPATLRGPNWKARP